MKSVYTTIQKLKPTVVVLVHQTTTTIDDYMKRLKMSKLTVEFDGDNGVALPNNKSKEYVDNVIANKATTPYVVIGSDLLLSLFRCAVIENKIKHTDLKFVFEEKTIDVDKYGTCREWPKGFGDAGINALKVLLCDRRKKNKDKIDEVGPRD